MSDPKRPMSEVSVRQSGIHGRGIFADRAFPHGARILEIDDSQPVRDRSKLTREQEIYIDVFIGVDGGVRTTFMNPPEALINHSCDPNTFAETDMATGVRHLVARRDIRDGEELTWDYAVNIWEEWVAPGPCSCGSRNCRKMIQGNFFTLPREDQRRYLAILDTPFKRRFAEQLRTLDLEST
jgi:uncharacterized protein